MFRLFCVKLDKYKRIAKKFGDRIFDDLVPFDNILENIEELNSNIKQIEKIIYENSKKDKDIIQLCIELKVKLCDRREYFETKYANIQYLNKNDKGDSFTSYYTDQFEFLNWGYFKVSLPLFSN